MAFSTCFESPHPASRGISRICSGRNRAWRALQGPYSFHLTWKAVCRDRSLMIATAPMSFDTPSAAFFSDGSRHTLGKVLGNVLRGGLSLGTRLISGS
jgi:hypothetical protein